MTPSDEIECELAEATAVLMVTELRLRAAARSRLRGSAWVNSVARAAREYRTAWLRERAVRGKLKRKEREE